MPDTSYRTYNVDDYDPAQFYEHHENQGTPNSGPDVIQVRQFLDSNKLEDALKSVILLPPLGHAEQDLKERCTSLVVLVLHSFKSVDIEEMVRKLELEDGDILMNHMSVTADVAFASCGEIRTWIDNSSILWKVEIVMKSILELYNLNIKILTGNKICCKDGWSSEGEGSSKNGDVSENPSHKTVFIPRVITRSNEINRNSEETVIEEKIVFFACL
ncbi:Protein CBG10797 [Caenorhabditis briggsae]|uniref:Actin-related protein 2/3 complex subunit 5 n=1 Tax=Caenorhabditis briggsae TaxID=6238 RepID=A8XBT7_CAEBR|nr:Protein CBG10797 [Caenorhabditis briggsae]CAP30103.2 Protein CBG10797 [Caenorhabditis briggsae]